MTANVIYIIHIKDYLSITQLKISTHYSKK